MKRTVAIAGALLLIVPLAPSLAAEGWRYGASGEFAHDDNATNGLYDADQKGDSILSVEGSATRSVLLGKRSGALFRAAAKYSHFTTFDDLSNLSLSGRAAWRIQPGTGFSSPIYEVAGTLEWLRHAESELRDGTIMTLEASVGSHVTDRTRLGGGFAFDQRNGGDPGIPGQFPIYDMDSTRFWVDVDYRFGARNTAYARVTQMQGDQVFNSITVAGISSQPDAWAQDPAFISELGRATESYRVDSSTSVFDLGVNWALDRASSLDFLFTSYSSKAKEGPQNGNKYSGSIIRATYLYRFQ
jgi:hypothetical protein